MKATKLFYMGKPMRKIYPHATWFQVQKYRARMAVIFVINVLLYMGAVLLLAMFIGANFFSSTTVVTANTTVEVPTMPDFPILAKIAQAESHNSQFCTAELVKFSMCHKYEIGAPLVRPVLSGSYAGTYDIGMYQINSSHLSDAIAKGFNVYELEGNRKYAEYLFSTQGSEPWYSSKAGWVK